MPCSRPTPRTISAAATIFLLSLAIVPPLSAQRPAGMSESPWWEEVRELEAELEKGSWKKVRRQAPELAKKITGLSWHHPDLKRIFAELAFYEAVAVANQGGKDPWAVWLWQIAQNIRPAIRDRDLSPYGRAGKLFREHLLRAHKEVPYRWQKEMITGPVSGRSLEPPRNLDQDDPPVMLESDAVKTEPVPSIWIELILDADSRLNQPVVFAPHEPHPAVLYATLRTVYDRRFSPLRLDGEPRPTLVDLEIDFKVIRGASRKKKSKIE